MNSWLVGTVAVLLWLGATGLYLRREILLWFQKRALERKMLAEARARYQAEVAAKAAEAAKPPVQAKLELQLRQTPRE